MADAKALIQPKEREMQPYKDRTRRKSKPTKYVGGAGKYNKRGSKPKNNK